MNDRLSTIERRIFERLYALDDGSTREECEHYAQVVAEMFEQVGWTWPHSIAPQFMAYDGGEPPRRDNIQEVFAWRD